MAKKILTVQDLLNQMKKQVKCTKCKEMTDIPDTHMFEGDIVCENCVGDLRIKSGYFTKARLKEYYFDDDGTRNADDIFLQTGKSFTKKELSEKLKKVKGINGIQCDTIQYIEKGVFVATDLEKIYFCDNHDFQIGDTFLMQTDYYGDREENVLIKVDSDDDFTGTNFVNCSPAQLDYETKGEIVTAELIRKSVARAEQLQKKYDAIEEIEEKLAPKDKEPEKSKEELKAEKKWKEEGIYEWTSSEYKFEGNTFTCVTPYYKTKDKVVAEVDYNSYIPYEDIADFQTKNHYPKINNALKFILTKTKSGNLTVSTTKRTANIHIEEGKHTFNGVEVCKARMVQIWLAFCDKDKLTDEHIKSISSLGATKIRLFDIENLQVEDVKMPISFIPDAKGGQTFKVVIGNAEKELSWEVLSEIFDIKNHRSYIRSDWDASKYLKFMVDKFEMTKESARELWLESKMLGAI